MFRTLNTMAAKVLTTSPLRLAQEGIGQLPCLTSSVRSLNTILRTSSDASGQASNSEQDKDKFLPRDASSNNSSQSSKSSWGTTDDLNTTRNTLSTAPCPENASSSVQSSKRFMKDKKSEFCPSEVDDKENEWHCSQNNFMQAVFNDALNFSSNGLKNSQEDILVPAKSLIELKSDFTANSRHSDPNVCAKKESSGDPKDTPDSSSKVSGSNKIPQSIPGIHQPRPFTVSIEGNIGSGKSTFLKHFASIPDVATYQEPLWKWTDVGGHNLLGKMYEDTKRWGFLFQSYVQLTRLHIHLTNEQPAKVKLIERSLHNNRYCFTESGHDSGDLQDCEFNVLCEYFDFLEENLDLGIDLIVYLRSTPEVVHQRMQQRGRAEEAGVPLAYLQRIHNYYERWLMKGVPHKSPAPVLVIDADNDLITVTRHYNAQKPIILGQVPYKAAERRGEKRPAMVSEQEAMTQCPNDDKSS